VLALLFPWHVPGCVTNLLSLPFTMSLYLVYRDEWLNLTWNIDAEILNKNFQTKFNNALERLYTIFKLVSF
jgi:hypothetical protein